MDKWKPDRSGKYLTVVYRDVDIGDEVLEITKHEKSCAMSWSHALWDVDYLKKCIKPQQRTAAEGEDTRRAWVGLTDEDIYFVYMTAQPAIANETVKRVARAIEAKLKEKNNVSR